MYAVYILAMAADFCSLVINKNYLNIFNFAVKRDMKLITQGSTVAYRAHRG